MFFLAENNQKDRCFRNAVAKSWIQTPRLIKEVDQQNVEWKQLTNEFQEIQKKIACFGDKFIAYKEFSRYKDLDCHRMASFSHVYKRY